jgi:glutamine amidotransferase
MISIVNYGLGNIKAIQNVYAKLDIPVRIVSDPSDLSNAEKIILPGVGAFDYAMSKLKDSGFRDVLDECVLKRKIPILGICVGMQMMAQSSEEGRLPGLGWVNAIVKRIRSGETNHRFILPHMGWNSIDKNDDNNLLKGLDHSAMFYFLHSYFVDCNNEKVIIATTFYNIQFTCAFNHGNIYGVQFHPEKSHHFGVRLLDNFARFC